MPNSRATKSDLSAPVPQPTGDYRPAESAAELVQVLDQYLADLQKGKAPDRSELLAAHPSLATRLDACLAGIQFIHGAASPDVGTPLCLGDFRIIREIGRGGMGAVYEAEQISLKRKVAVKVMRVGAVSDEEAMERFQREAETVAGLHHTNIVPIFAVASEKNVNYYAMQFIQGRSLDAVLRDAHAPLDPDEIADWGLQSAEALAYAHQRGVIHRDVKPSNLMVDENQVVWLTDFGLAKRLDDVTLSLAGALLGTPRYMSPEQASSMGRHIDHRTDIYSLGATLYELATGDPVFRGETPHKVIAQILEADPVPPRELRPDLPRNLVTIILKCLSKNPAERYATAEELVDDLRAFLEGRPIKARQPNAFEKAAQWVRQRRQFVGVAAAAATVAAIVVIGGLLVWNGYGRWRQGSVRFTTDTPPLIAEVLDPNDRLVTAPFTVPTQQRRSLPAGDYQVRFSGPGQLSETFSLAVFRGKEQKLNISLRDRTLGPTLQVPQTFQMFELADGADALCVTNQGISRHDGATTHEIWSTRLDRPGAPALRDAKSFHWHWKTATTRSGRGKFDRSPLLLRPSVDLNDDGAADLVFACQHQSSLIALSGQDGEVLWAFGPGSLETARQADPRHKDMDVQSTTLGTPTVVKDLDGDSKPELIATFVDSGAGNDQRGQPRRWIEAISGGTGKSIWSIELDRDWFTLPPGNAPSYECRWFLGSSDGSYGSGSTSGSTSRGTFRDDFESKRGGVWIYVPEPATVVGIGAQQVVVLMAGRMLVGYDLATGMPVWTPHDVGVASVRAPIFKDVDGDQVPEAIIVGSQSSQTGTSSRTSQLTVLSLLTRQPLWKPRRIDAQWGFQYYWHQPPREWPVVSDLDGDGLPEIVVPNGSSMGGAVRKTGPFGIVEVLDGRTGESRWSRRVRCMDQQVDRFTVGPDINGDMHRDIFVASLTASGYNQPLEVFVDALSGKDGQPLWWSRKVLAGDVDSHEFTTLGAPQWWNHGPGRWPQLLVSVLPEPKQGHASFFSFNAATGRLEHVAPDIGRLQLADGDGDGVDDLFVFQPKTVTRFDDGGRLHAFRGGTRELWRRVGRRWFSAEDLDGDGTTDLLNVPNDTFDGPKMTAMSGRSGKLLWQHDAPSTGRFDDVRCLPTDLDGDRVTDILAAEGHGSSTAFSPLHAFSGRTGRRLWSADLHVSQCQGPLLMESRDLDGDGHEEVVYVAALTPQEESRGRGLSSRKLKLWMVLLSGRTGKIIWKQTLVDSTTRVHLGNGGRMRVACVDMDGDSWLDLVVPAVESPSEFQLRGYSGKTGKLLWRHQLPPDDSCKEHQALWNLPDPVVSDLDNDGFFEILLVDYHNRNQENSGRGQRIGELVALSATNGQPQWTWETPLEDLHSGIADSIRHRPIPIVLRQPSSGSQQRAVCVWFWGRPGFAVVLDATGHVLQRIEVGRKAGPPWFRVWKDDADQDRTDELFLQRDGCVQAFRIGLDQPLWSWSIPGAETRAPRAEMMGIRQGSKGLTATIRIHVLNKVFGINAASGKQLWHCEGPNTKMELSWPSWPESVSIVDGPDKDARLPGVVFQLKDMAAVCRQAVADKAAPSVVQPERLAQHAVSDAVDPRLVRPLPWVSRTGLSWMEVGQLLGNATLLATLLFIVPGRYAFWMLRRRQWGLKAFLLLPVVVMLMVLAIRLNVPYLPAHLASVRAKLILGLVGVPGLMFPLLLIVWGFRRYWGRAAVWLSAALVVALLITVFGLWADRDKLVNEHYSFQGWYIPALIGGYVAGSIMLLALPCWNFIVYRRRTWQ